MLSIRKVCLKNLTILSIFFCISSHIHAQIDIKSKVDAQTYEDYSKAIELFEKNINPNEVVTLFIPINYAFNRLSIEKQISLTNNNSNEINLFINNHKSFSIIDNNFLKSNYSSNISENYFYLKNNKKIYFQKNINKFLFGDSYDPTNVSFESHVVKSLVLDNNIVLNFLDGIFLY